MFLKDATKAMRPVVVMITMMAMFPQKAKFELYFFCRTKKSDGKMKLRGTNPMEPTIPITSAKHNSTQQTKL